MKLPTPIYGLAIEAKRRGDEQRLWEILSKLTAEDPCLKVEHIINTNETVIFGLGELHLRVMLERMSEIFKIEVATRPPKIAYRETITAGAEGHFRHKKQTGGAGQFGEVFLAHRAAGARRRIRVRRQGKRRNDPHAVHSRRRKRDTPGARNRTARPYIRA